ncbi:MAG: hypothetical protein P4K98_08260 [Bryobacteraceae bacterium]|nr:hypothetical protein [Bryobacteraceae bacterium]
MSALITIPEAVRVVVPGKFWDSQLYAGTLYLFGLSGELSTLSWDKLVADLPVPDRLRVAADFALLGNHRLYEPGARLLLSDPDIRLLLQQKFHELCAQSPWEALPADGSVDDNPLPFPHNDSEVHYSNLYVGASEGLFCLEMAGAREDGRCLSEVPTFNIAAKYQTIAQAAGSAGLFAVRIGNDPRTPDQHPSDSQTQVSELPCMTCEWATSSIIAAGFNNNVYVAMYESSNRPNDRLGNRRPERTFHSIISESDIYGEDPQRPRGFIWGAGDKILRFGDDRVEVVQYGRNKRKEPTFSIKGNIPLDNSEIGESIVSARVASFGSVIERDDGLFVMLTTGDSLSLPGEPTNWRVFPRSRNYLNHLHIIYSDRLEVWAFTHDYFVDQEAKLEGLNAAASD